MFSEINYGQIGMQERTQEVEWRTNLRDGEVDGHLFTMRMIEGFGVGEEGTSLEILEFSNDAAAGKVELEL